MNISKRSSRVTLASCLVIGLIYIGTVVGQESQESKSADKANDVESNESLGDIAEDLNNRMQKGQPPPIGTTPQIVDPKGEEDHPAVVEEKVITDSGMLAFLNFGFKENGQPPVSMEELGSVDLGVLPKEYFIVVDREGDEHPLIEWISGEFLRIRETGWECWRPANRLIEENIIRGKVFRSVPDQKFVVFLWDDGNLRSALLKIRGRLWVINMSRPDGLSPVIPLVPQELFYEHLRDNEKDKKEK